MSSEAVDPADAVDSTEDQPQRKDLLHFDAEAVAAYRSNSRVKATRPDPKIVVTADFCVNPKGGSCKRCVMACPVAAIRLGTDGLPQIDSEACTFCGICLGICDAFTSNDVTMTDLASRVSRAAQRGEGVFIACAPVLEGEDDPAPCVVEVPCLAALSPEFWTSLLAEGIELRAVCDFERCAKCARGGDVAEMLYTHAIETAQAWTQRTIDVVDEVPAKTGYLQSFVQHGDVDRRGVFTHFAGNVEDAASGEYRKRNSSVLQDFYERQERMRAQTRQMQNTLPEVNRHAQSGSVMKLMQPKRRMLLQAIEHDASIAERVQLVVSDTDCASCCNALDCAGACPTSARYPDADTGLLSYDVRYCIGCGNCVRACFAHAAHLVEVPASLLDAAPGIVCVQALERLRAERREAARKARSAEERLSEAD
ncbi:MAG: 4Fe-4S ferredoxin [Eggerthellaceae bacterium]|nr:4Fe-4S ferredoxin [Eggerthellaceae bacterium]